MDCPEYSSLAVALADVPDPRRARGKRHPWPLVLTLIGAAVLSGQRGVRAIGQWVEERAEELTALLQPPRGRLPSVATLRTVDVEALERQVARVAAGVPEPAGAGAPRWAGLALDGKALRGANAHGAAVHLVSLVRHADAAVLGQVRVAAKGNESTAAPRLWRGATSPGR